MAYQAANPLIVQSDMSVLLEVDNPAYEAARDGLARFAELEKSPEHIHTYRITRISLWNAAAAGMTASAMIETLETYSKFDLPPNVRQEIADSVSRYGLVRLEKQNDAGDDGWLALTSEDPVVLDEIWHAKKVRPLLLTRLGQRAIAVEPAVRGRLKQALIQLGFPVEDLAGYVPGAPLRFSFREKTRAGKAFRLRDYQKDAVAAFHAGGAAHGGSGVIVLPCGGGKTVIGMAVMERLQCETLILATNVTAVRQWIRELVDKTDLPAEMIGEYTGETKEIKPVTVATYHILTHREKKGGPFPHFALFDSKDWGLVIYDEVHMLPAEVFRITAEVQARRRLGLTATLVREDGREPDVFTLIGPKKYDMPWKDLEQAAWIAAATCYEVRIPLAAEICPAYAVAEPGEKFRLASENPGKLPILEALVAHHQSERVLVIGAFVSQLEEIAQRLNAPLITGKTPTKQRETLFEGFRTGEIDLLVVSKVANFAVDLPDANVAIEVSGSFGSRQEEAQRLGRLLRPKEVRNEALFYALVSHDSREQEFAANRQRFLTEQGYRYLLFHGDQLVETLASTPAGQGPKPPQSPGMGERRATPTATPTIPASDSRDSRRPERRHGHPRVIK